MEEVREVPGGESNSPCAENPDQNVTHDAAGELEGVHFDALWRVISRIRIVFEEVRLGKEPCLPIQDNLATSVV